MLSFSSGVNLQYPVHDNNLYPSRVTFEVIHSEPPEFKADFSSFANITEEGRKESKPFTDIKASVVKASGKKVNLYIPQSNQVSEVFQYDTPGLGIAGGTANTLLDNGASVNSAIGNALSQGFKGMSDLIGAFGGESLGRVAAVRAANFAPISQAAKDAVSVTARTTVHPNMRTMFKSVGVRKFQFLFKFIPRSYEESNQVRAIINFFRYYSYPEEIKAQLDGSTNISVPVGYKYPDMFRIRMQTRDTEVGTWVRHGVNIIDSYIESINTNYNPQTAVYHANGDPVEIDLSLSFVEHRALGRDDIEIPAHEQKEMAVRKRFQERQQAFSDLVNTTENDEPLEL